MNAKELLIAAKEAVEGAQIPDDLRVAAFGAAISFLQRDMNPGPQQKDQKIPSQSAEHSTTPKASQKPLTLIAKELGIDENKAERLFDIHDEELQFVGDVGKLGSTKSKRVANLAIVYLVARQAGEFDNAASFDSILRKEVDRQGLFDSTNYGKHIALLKKYFNINGTGKTATYKAKFEGRTEAKKLASALLNDD